MLRSRWPTSFEAAVADHESRVARGERARVAWRPGWPSGVFRYHDDFYVTHVWSTRRWTLGAPEPWDAVTITDVTDDIPALVRTLFIPDGGREPLSQRHGLEADELRALEEGRVRLAERWARTRIMLADGTLVAQVATPVRSVDWRAGPAPAEWDAPPLGVDVTWTIKGYSTIGPFDGEAALPAHLVAEACARAEGLR